MWREIVLCEDSCYTEGSPITVCCRFDYELVLGITPRRADKATRLLYKDTEMTHAMVLTGANVEVSHY